MKGWKTWLAAIAGACTGIVRICTALTAQPTVDAQGIYEGITIIAGAIGIVGIGHKIEKSLGVTEPAQAATPTPQAPPAEAPKQ